MEDNWKIGVVRRQFHSTPSVEIQDGPQFRALLDAGFEALSRQPRTPFRELDPARKLKRRQWKRSAQCLCGTGFRATTPIVVFGGDQIGPPMHPWFSSRNPIKPLALRHRPRIHGRSRARGRSETDRWDASLRRRALPEVELKVSLIEGPCSILDEWAPA